jgi:hypothetical protein
MASMSYCVLENTSIDMAGSVEKLNKFQSLEDLRKRAGDHEYYAAKHLARLAAEYLEIFELVEAGQNAAADDDDESKGTDW